MPLTRSEQMARIRGRDTRPELLVREACAALGLGGVAYVPVLGTHPDLVFDAERLAIFVDGCFWHGCPEHYCPPSTRAGYWRERLRRNVERDRRQTLLLEANGWRVVRVWEHEVRAEVTRMASLLAEAASRGGTPSVDWRVVGVFPPTRPGAAARRHLVDLRESWRQRVEEG